MALVNIPPQTPPQPPDPVQLAHLKSKSMATQIYVTLAKAHTELYNLFWDGKVDTQDLLDKWGTDAAQLFVVSSAIQDVLAAANPEYVRLVPNKDVTLNQDGTVTVNE